MANHVLSVEAPDTLNKCILRLVDTSVYTSSPITCPLLQVTLPGYSQAVSFDNSSIQPGFNVNLTACDLEVQTSNCGSVYNDLPDGIYVIRYSVSPNDIVYVEYNHLRITMALWKMKELWCDLDLAACEPGADKKAKLRMLLDIKGYLEAAKAEVEFCLHPKKGMELYTYAMKLIDKMNCKTCH